MTKPADIPKAPKHLRPATRRWFDRIAADYELLPHDYELLRLAGEALDRCAEAREVLAREGLTVPGSNGPRTHPAAAIERDSRLAHARLMRELRLSEPAPDARAPRSGRRW